MIILRTNDKIAQLKFPQLVSSLFRTIRNPRRHGEGLVPSALIGCRHNSLSLFGPKKICPVSKICLHLSNFETNPIFKHNKINTFACFDRKFVHNDEEHSTHYQNQLLAQFSKKFKHPSLMVTDSLT